MKKIRIASRSSKLALWQANFVGQMLDCEYEIIEVSTGGDKNLDVSISQLAGTGAFVKEVQVAVLENKADIACHSAKDLPSITPEGLELVAVPVRGDVRDVLIGSTLEDLKYGARIGTGAVRRRAQLCALRPDLQFGELRGNIETRISKAKDFDAIVLANVALQRLGLTEHVSEVLSIHTMLPQVAQGALAVEARSDDIDTKEILNKINNRDAFNCVNAERAFLAELGGGCSIPCGAYAIPIDSQNLWLRVMLAEPRGRTIAHAEIKGSNPSQIGKEVADDLLKNKGGQEILEMVI
ncbi:MAG: hydroxymethylbilane synthase [Acidimicrobiia bacterium]